ncbi:MAG: SpoIIIAH-like family protein [Oscillospiraceae bacterium]|nr:SpoIIIAH-like family protein [Oscillospiraceae bacterium]
MKKTRFFRKIKMPRINMVIGKKQIIVTGLTLLLGTAIYVNYIYSSAGGGEQAELYEIVSSDDSGVMNYGDAAFVSSAAVMSDETKAYFAQARMDLQESRDEAKDFLQAMYSGGDMRGEELEVMARSAERLRNFIEIETKVENLLKAQGFADALVYISDRGVNVIVKTDGLDAAGAAKIKNTLLSEVNVIPENITVVEIN